MSLATRIRQSPAAMLVLALLLALAVMTDSRSAELELKAGDQATYTAGSQSWCVTVQSIATGAGAVPWAWATVNADPRRVVHLPVWDFTPGCKP